MRPGIAALAEDVDINRGVAQLQGQPTLTVPGALELQVGDAGLFTAYLLDAGDQAVGVTGWLDVVAGGVLTDDEIEAVAFHPGLVGHQLDQVQHHAGAVTGFQHHHAGGVAVGQGVALARQGAAGAGKIDRDPGRLFDSVSLHVRRGFVKIQAHLELAARAGSKLDVSYRWSRIYGLCEETENQHCCQILQSPPASARSFSHGILPQFRCYVQHGCHQWPLRQMPLNSIVRGRSTHPSALPSLTISTTAT